MNGPGGGRRTSTAKFTIRFPQIDAAGIVFYPRYFEMIAHSFPWLHPETTPSVIETRFLKPNRLGDQLQLEIAAAPDCSAWTINGTMSGETHFTMQSIGAAGERDHVIPEAAFETERVAIGDWSVGSDGRLQLSRSFELVNVAIEEWFEHTLGMPFQELHVGRKTGIPTVSFRTVTRKLPRAGTTVTVGIRPTKIGNRSMSFTSWITGDEGWLIQNDQVIVFVRMLDAGYELMRIPDGIKRAFAGQLEANG